MTLPTMKAGARQMGLDELRVMPRDTPTIVTLTGEFIISGCGLPVFLPDGSDGPTIPLACLSKEFAPTARVEVLPPPIDPDLILAREWFKARPNTSFTDEAIDEGYCDNQTSIQGFLAGLKASKAGGRV